MSLATEVGQKYDLGSGAVFVILIPSKCFSKVKIKLRPSGSRDKTVVSFNFDGRCLRKTKWLI